MFKFADMLQ